MGMDLDLTEVQEALDNLSKPKPPPLNMSYDHVPETWDTQNSSVPIRHHILYRAVVKVINVSGLGEPRVKRRDHVPTIYLGKGELKQQVRISISSAPRILWGADNHTELNTATLLEALTWLENSCEEASHESKQKATI